MEKSNRFSLDDANSIISEYPEQDISAYQRGSISPVNIEALETRAQGNLNFFEDILFKSFVKQNLI